MGALEAIESKPIETEREKGLAARSRFYWLLAESFRYPDKDFQEQVRGGELDKAFVQVAADLPFNSVLEQDAGPGLTLSGNVNADDMDVEFIRLFDAGPGSPPCPLMEGLHRPDDRKTIFKNLILFYNNFGLSYAEGSMEDRPDHITYEMEFLHYLAFLMLTAEQRGTDHLPYLRAQRDFLERHPLRWMGSLAERIESIRANLREDANREVVDFYAALIRLTHRFVKADAAYLENAP